MPFEALVDYCVGSADDARSSVVRRHLDNGCERCERSMQWLTAALTDLRAAGQIVAPSFSLEPGRAIFRERQRTPERRPLFARLVFDSRLPPALAGVRGGARQAFKRLYSTAHHDIEIWHEPMQGECWYLIGQALPREGGPFLPPTAVHLMANNGEIVPALLDGDEFHFSQISAGAYALRLLLPDAEIVVADLLIEG